MAKILYLIVWETFDKSYWYMSPLIYICLDFH